MREREEIIELPEPRRGAERDRRRRLPFVGRHCRSIPFVGLLLASRLEVRVATGGVSLIDGVGPGTLELRGVGRVAGLGGGGGGGGVLGDGPS